MDRSCRCRPGFMVWILLAHLSVVSVLLSITFPGVQSVGAGSLYRGKYIGRLTPRQHKVSGEVYAVDSRTLHIRNFVYDGNGPDAFFWTGFTEHPSPQGVIVPNEKGTKEVLGAYNNQDITLTLPEGLSVKDIKWFSVWCRAYEVNFGDLYIPADLDYPQPHVIGSLSGQHAVSSGPIVVVDAQTILVPDFTYDGQAPDVFFWVGRGKPGPNGTRVADETGGDSPLLKADRKTMVLSLPGDLTIFDIDYFGIWCRLYYVDFGHVKVPQPLNVPPSLRMLGVTPQTKLNCEVLMDSLALEVRWAVAGSSIVLQLVGRIGEGQYMSFGISGDESRSVMIGGDVVVGWYDSAKGVGHVVDYYLDSKAQCSGRRGTCPDSRIQPETNNVRLLSATVVNGFTMLTFQRPLKAHDDLDKSIITNTSQAVIFAVGPINQRQEASYHTTRNKDDMFIDFGRVPKWNCPAPEPEFAPHATTPFPGTTQYSSGTTHTTSSTTARTTTTTTLPTTTQPPSRFPGVSVQLTGEMRPVEIARRSTTSAPVSSSKHSSSIFKIPPIKCNEPEDRVFYAQIGPTGGKKGYAGLTGHVGWGIAWYINGLLVPEVYLVRGKTYTFVVEGGDDPEVPAKYHPFYITDDPEGGYQYKSETDKKKVKVFAGMEIDGNGVAQPTAAGRLCQWIENGDQPADSFVSYGAYQRSLSLQCDEGHPGILHWTPDDNTPDTVYYQCFVHRFLGWKIHIVDDCGSDAEPIVGASEVLPTIVAPDGESAESRREVNVQSKELDSDPMSSVASSGSIHLAKNEAEEQSHFNQKQEPSALPYSQHPASPSLIPANAIFLNPVQYSNNGFMHTVVRNRNPDPFSQVIHGPTPFTRLYPAEAQIVHSIEPFISPFGQRLMDRPKPLHPNQPEFRIDPSRSPLMSAHGNGRFGGLPPILYATMTPPEDHNSRYKIDTHVRPTYITNAESGSPPDSAGVLRWKEGRNHPLNKNRPLWSHSRKLPTRENSRESDKLPLVPSNIHDEDLSVDIREADGSSEVVRTSDDTNSLPFLIPPSFHAPTDFNLEQRRGSRESNQTELVELLHLLPDSSQQKSEDNLQKPTELPVSAKTISPPHLETFEPVFRPSLPDTTGLAFNMSHVDKAILDAVIHAPENNHLRGRHFPHAYQRPLQKLPEPRFQQLPNLRLQNLHHMSSNKYDGPRFNQGMAMAANQFARRNRAPHVINERKEMQEVYTRRHRNPAHFMPVALNSNTPVVSPDWQHGTILSYDGRPVYVSETGINYRKHSEKRTPLVHSLPQYTPFRSELLQKPQSLKSDNRGSETSRGSSEMAVPNNGPERRQDIVRQRNYLVKPSSESESQISRGGGVSGKEQQQDPSKMEVIPNHDVTMVVVKGMDAKGLEEELPRILHHLGQEIGNDERELSAKPKTTRGESSGSLELPTTDDDARADEKLELNSTNGYKSQQNPASGKNNTETDLHILTDIWSIINNQDESAKSPSRPTNPNFSHRRRSPSVNSRQTLPFLQPHYRQEQPAAPLYRRRRQRKEPGFTDTTEGDETPNEHKLRVRRNAHHEDGHDDHIHANNSTYYHTNEERNAFKSASTSSFLLFPPHLRSILSSIAVMLFIAN